MYFLLNILLNVDIINNSHLRLNIEEDAIRNKHVFSEFQSMRKNRIEKNEKSLTVL